MSFVYRYVDDSGTVRYVGKVVGNSPTKLASRIRDHVHDKGFEPGWRVEYIGNLSAADADIIETWLIAAVPQEPLINKAKRWGPTDISLTGLPAFVPWDPSSDRNVRGALQRRNSHNGKFYLNEDSFIRPLMTRAPTLELPAFVSVREASEITGIPETSIMFGLREGKIPFLMERRGKPTHASKIPSSCLSRFAVVFLPEEEVAT